MDLSDTELNEVCDQIAAGGRLRGILKLLNLQVKPFYRRINTDDAARNSYIRAIECRAHAFAEQSIDVAEDESIDPHRGRNIMAALQWVASKQNRASYGDKVDLNISGSIDYAKLQLEARRRVLEGRIVDGQAVRVGDSSISQLGKQDLDSNGLIAIETRPDIFE